MSMFKREWRQWAPEPFVPPFPGTNMFSGGVPSTQAALASSAVWACVSLIASSVAMLPLHAFTVSADGVRTPVPDPPLLTMPAADTPISEWVYMLMASLLLKGNAYGRIVARDYMGYPTQIELLAPDDVSVKVEAGRVVYRVNGVVVPSLEIFHVKAWRMPGLPVGLSPIQFAALTINRDKAIQDFALGYFRDAPHPSSVLTSDQAINQEQARTIKERLITAVQGREPLVLGAGLKFSPLSVSPEESQFLATQKYGVAEIARMFNTAPELIAAEAGNSMTYANIESKGIDFLRQPIQWWLTIVESAVSQLLPGKRHARFDPSVLLRTDLKTLMDATAIGIASHQLLPDEARAMADRAPFTPEQKKEADLVPMTVSPSGRPLALPGSAPAGEGATP